MLINPSEEVIEGLDADQLELQGIIGMGRFVDFFRKEVDYWQKHCHRKGTALHTNLATEGRAPDRAAPGRHRAADSRAE